MKTSIISKRFVALLCCIAVCVALVATALGVNLASRAQAEDAQEEGIELLSEEVQSESIEPLEEDLTDPSEAQTEEEPTVPAEEPVPVEEPALEGEAVPAEELVPAEEPDTSVAEPTDSTVADDTAKPSAEPAEGQAVTESTDPAEEDALISDEGAEEAIDAAPESDSGEADATSESESGEADVVNANEVEEPDADTTGESIIDVYGIMPLMDGTGSTFPVNTIYALSVTWTVSGTGETVYSWTRDNYVTDPNNSDESTINALASGEYRVEVTFENHRSDRTLEVGETYVLALDWSTEEGATVSTYPFSGTITNSSGTELATWVLDPATGEITFTILALSDENTFSLNFTATITREDDEEPEGDPSVSDAHIQKDGMIDEMIDDTIIYTITAVVPRYDEKANGGKAYVWSIDDRMQSDLIYGGDYNNSMSDVVIGMTSTEYPEGIAIPSVENATEADEIAYYIKVDSDKEDEIIFLNRCTCDEDNCANWSEGCDNVYGDTGFCSCWLYIYNATFTITYSVDISEIIQGMEDHANASAYTQIMNSAILYNGPNSPVDNDSDAEYVYRPFTKSETTSPDRNTENKGVGSYKIEISEHDIDYSWAEDIEITDAMNNLALVEDSLTVTIGNTVLTLIDEDEVADLNPETDRDKYFSFTYTDITDDGEVTGGTLVVKIWYPTNQNITIEYQASVISYNTSPTGDYSNAVTLGEVGYTLTGSYQEGSSGEGGSGLTLSMTLTKVDAHDNAVVLPGAVFNIYRHVEDGDDILVDTLTTGEDGTFTFASNDDKGYWMDRDVLYYVEEIQAPDGYAPDKTLYGFVFLRNGYEGTYPDGLDPQNVIMGEPDGNQIHIEITVENTPITSVFGIKAWQDGDNKNGARPDSITVHLYADGIEADSIVVTADDDWAWEFNDLPVYNESGEEIVYTVSEDEVDGYIGTLTGDTENGYEFTNSMPQITKEIAEDDYVRKEDSGEHMHDGEDTYGDGWGTWDDADNNQEVTYHLILTDIKDAVNLTVHDYLEDGLDFEPDTVVIDLYDAGSDTVLTEGSDYTEHEGTCSDPNGCAMDGCTFEVAFDDAVFEDISSDAYLVISYKALTDTAATDYTDYEDDILNHSYMTYGIASYRSGIVTTETDLFGFGVYKYADENGSELALEGASFILARADAYAVFEEDSDDEGNTYYMISGWVSDQTEAGILISGADGMVRIEGLDDDTYTLTEVAAPVGYEIIDSAITVTIDENGGVTADGVTGSKEAVIGHVVNVENALITTQISVEKIWDDADDQDGLRPASVKVELLADGVVIDTQTLSDANGWAYSWDGLPVYADGSEISYSIGELTVSGYITEVSGDAASGFVITNTHTPETVDISGTKTWDDADNQDGLRPASITVRLLADGVEVSSLEVSEADGWAWSWSGLPKYAEGSEISYSVTEDAVPDYSASYAGYDITNSYTPGKTSLSVVKVWADSDDADGLRPDEIAVILVANGSDTDQVLILSEDNGWQGTFTDLEEYADGEKIVYSVRENVTPDGYEVTITGDAGVSFVITNTHTPTPSTTVSVSVTKIWDDDNDAAKARPELIVVVLMQDGAATTQTLILSEENNWSGSFDGLAEYTTDGEKIVYSIAEVDVPNYSSVITGDQDSGFTVTNTYVAPEEPGNPDKGEPGTPEPGNPDDGMPKTGQDALPIAPIAVSGAAIVAAGVTLLVVRRRRAA